MGIVPALLFWQMAFCHFSDEESLADCKITISRARSATHSKKTNECFPGLLPVQFYELMLLTKRSRAIL
jgi:hypothetical protein